MSAKQLDVLLLRDVPEERRYSMERFADELERSLASSNLIKARSFALHESSLAARLGLRTIDSYLCRFVRYPILARFLRTDVYHIVDHGYGHLAALLPPSRTVATCHDLMLLRAAEGQAGFAPRSRSVARFRWSTSYLRRVAHVVCDSEATRADVVRLIGVKPERTSVVPLGVGKQFRTLDPEYVRRATPELRISADHVVLHVSTGNPYKNVPTTLSVLAALKRMGHRVVLARVGVPLDLAQARLAGQLGVDRDVIELGRVTDDRLVEVYNAADVLLFPSHFEGFGLPLLEAMACGTPVVASTAPSILELVGDAAVVAPPTDVQSLSEMVASLLSTPALAKRLGERGRARAAQYTWSRTAAAYAALYAQVFANRAEAPVRARVRKLHRSESS